VLRVDYATLESLGNQANSARVAMETTVEDMNSALYRVMPGSWTGTGFDAFAAAYGQYVRAANGIHQMLLDIEKTLVTCEVRYAETESSVARNFTPAG
jgi:WXG100 family type VII secretion target